MSSGVPAGTPAAAPEVTPAGGGTPAAAPEGSEGQVTVSAQFKKEALESWKPKAEQFNKVEAENRALAAKLEEMQRIAYGGGLRQATDPEAEMIAQLQEQAAYDPTAKAALFALKKATIAEVELDLSEATAELPRQKRELVRQIIRNAKYQMGVDQALSLVSDPDTEDAKAKLAQAQAEIEQLKARPPLANAASPAAATPTGDAKVAGKETVPWSTIRATLKGGGEAARKMRDRMDAGEVQADYRK